jgi:thiol-disulfide isomerase/thioredoxin
MRGKIFGFIKEIVLAIIMMAVIMNVISFLKKPDLKSTALPTFEYITIDNKKISSKDYTDKPLLIHFWATWCPTCKLEASNIEELSKSYDVISVAVNSGTDDEIKKYMKDRDLNYNTINDKNGEFSSQFLVKSFPTSFIYDKNNQLRFCEVGYTSTWGLKIRMWLAN